MSGADKTVKCREAGVTRYAAGYTVFFFQLLCDLRRTFPGKAEVKCIP